MAGIVDLDGVPTWHDVRGDGSPVVLLHGGFSDSGEFDAGLARLVDDGHRVHRYDRRGQGRTADVAGPLDPEVYSRDLVVYLERVVGARPRSSATATARRWRWPRPCAVPTSSPVSC